MKWFTEKWLPKVKALTTKFRLLFGDPTLPENDRFHFGLNEYFYSTFFKPKHEKTYKALLSVIKNNYLELYGKACANMLVFWHAKFSKDAKPNYPFLDKTKKRPVPEPIYSAKRYYTVIRNTRNAFRKEFCPGADKKFRPDYAKLSKRKFYRCPKCGVITPNKRCPLCGGPCDGPFDESILNPADDPDEK